MSEHNLFYRQIQSLLLYQSIFDNEIGTAFLNLLQTLDRKDSNCLKAYSNWFKNLAVINQSWQDYLIDRILQDDNPFSQQIQRVDLQEIPRATIAAVKYDLNILQNIYKCTPEQISQWVQTASNLSVAPVVWNLKTAKESFLHRQTNWTEALTELADYYRQHGTGIFARERAFRWQQGQFLSISNPDPIQLDEIVGYELQKQALQKNTEFLLAGYTALNVLLYGSRGSGKSSLVKGLLQEYGERGLRLIEVGKSELKDLSAIVETLRDRPQKFIIFVDDLSFEEDNDAFKALKVVLEGSLTAKAKNVVVYATSNRRHLIREFFDDRPRPSDADEVHSWDTVQEKLSFSDRFGLTLTFEPANQDTYLDIVRHLAAQEKIEIDREELEFRAKQWATRHNGRSGRTARQFINFLYAELIILRSNP
ncbi:MAG: ATP-binding protein [Xenococcaceae cyanobacterium]